MAQAPLTFTPQGGVSLTAAFDGFPNILIQGAQRSAHHVLAFQALQSGLLLPGWSLAEGRNRGHDGAKAHTPGGMNSGLS